jgi:putative membrane protein
MNIDRQVQSSVKRSLLIAGLTLGLGMALGGPAAAAPSPQDSAFVTQAAQAGLAEVQLASLALQKSKTRQVVSFARHMKTDHSKANTQLAQIATVNGFALPSDAGPKNEALMAKLRAASGSAFDTHYLKSQLPAHRQVLALFEQEASSGQNAALAAFAKRTIPVIQKHIAMAKHDIAEFGGGAVGMRSMMPATH